MNSSFNPYHKWLGIPPEEQPPDHYRLLGVRLFESDSEVIDISADRQLTHVRSFANGPHSELSQKLLNEISAARLCLLVPDQKAAYDAQLRQRLTSGEPQPPEPPPAVALPDSQGDFSPLPRFAASYGVIVGGLPGAIARVISYRTLLVIASIALAATGLALIVVWMVLGTDHGADADRKGDIAQLSSSHLPPPEPPRTGQSQPESSLPEKGQSNGGRDDQPLVDVLPSDTDAASPTAGTSNTSAASSSSDSKTSLKALLRKLGKKNAAGDTGRSRSARNANVDGGSKRAKPPRGSVADGASKSDGDSAGAGPRSGTSSGPLGRSVDPFGRLPDETELGFDDWTGPISQFVLGTLSSPADKSFSVSIDSGAADFGGLELSVGQPTTSGNEIRWPIEFASADALTDPKTEATASQLDRSIPLAYVVAAHETLSIELNAQQRAEQVRQLRNCILSFSDGTHSHQSQLRKALRESAISFDLSHANITRELSLDDPPVESGLVLKVEVAGNRAADVVANPRSREVGLNDDVSLTLLQWPGAEIAVRMYRSGGQYRVKVVCRYELSGRNYPLTKEEIAKEITRMQNQVAENQKDVQEAQVRLRKIPVEMDRLSNMNPRDPRESVLLHSAADQLAKEGKKLESRIRRLSEATPQLEENIAALKTLEPLVRQLDGQLTMRVRVFAQTTDRRIELYSAR